MPKTLRAVLAKRKPTHLIELLGGLHCTCPAERSASAAPLPRRCAIDLLLRLDILFVSGLNGKRSDDRNRQARQEPSDKTGDTRQETRGRRRRKKARQGRARQGKAEIEIPAN